MSSLFKNLSTGTTSGIKETRSPRRRRLLTRTKNSLDGEICTLPLDVPVAAVPGWTIPRPSSPLRLHGVSTLHETPRPTSRSEDRACYPPDPCPPARCQWQVTPAREEPSVGAQCRCKCRLKFSHLHTPRFDALLPPAADKLPPLLPSLGGAPFPLRLAHSQRSLHALRLPPPLPPCGHLIPLLPQLREQPVACRTWRIYVVDRSLCPFAGHYEIACSSLCSSCISSGAARSGLLVDAGIVGCAAEPSRAIAPRLLGTGSQRA